MEYKVVPVVCDYGIYRDGKCIDILNSRSNAEKICEIWKADDEHKVWEDNSPWISVKDKLPKEWDEVLVCYKCQGGIGMSVSARFKNDRWTALCGMKPTHWMPLPKSPEEVR